MAVRHDLTAALGVIEQLSLGGIPLDQILLELVAPTARLLGDQWLDDERSFMEVSAALGTLQQVTHTLSPATMVAGSHRGTVLLTGAPNEQHTLGLFLVGEFFRRAGFGVHVEPSMTVGDILDFVARDHVVLVGFSASSEERLPGLADLIQRVRAHSQNRAVHLMLGGSLDLEDFARQTRTTLCGRDPRAAVNWLGARVDEAGREDGELS